MKITEKFFNNKLAQAAVELAVFGAILIFIIGSIIRVSLSSSYQQNQTLKAMRYAFTKSLESSKAKRADRNRTTVLYLEDRLSADFSSYGTVDRLPFIISASGTLSFNLFMPIDYREYQNIAIMDLYVNGQHFAFSAADFLTYDITRGDPTSKDEVIKRKGEDWLENCYERSCKPPPLSPPVPSGDPVVDAYALRTYNALVLESKKCMCDRDDPGKNLDPRPFCQCSVETDSASVVMLKKICGCQRFYSSVARGSIEYCDGDSVKCPQPPASALTDNERFDLTRDRDATNDPNGKEIRRKIAWQWNAVKGVVEDLKPLINASLGQYALLDVDADLKEEVLYKFSPELPDIEILQDGFLYKFDQDYGPVTKVWVQDFQLGDINLDDESRSPADAPGLKQEVDIYTFVDETYLEIKEGKIYNKETNVYVRSANKKDQIDVVARTFQLSNDTGRLCSNGRNRLLTTDPTYAKWDMDYFDSAKKMGQPNTKVNPDVEACNDCFSKDNIAKTCFDEGTKKLFIRSRIKDTRGRKWITDTGPLIER